MNLTRNNGSSGDDDEAQTLASEWIERLECSLLARLSEDKNCLESSRVSSRSLASLDGLPAASRSERVEGASLVPSIEEIRRKKFKDTECVGNKSECTRPGTDPLCMLQSDDQEERHNEARKTPRMNLDLIRQKRLEYFQQGSQNVLHKDDVVEKKNSKCSAVSVGRLPDVSHRHDLRCNPGLGSCEVYDNVSPRSCGEDDEIRLDLWGLKDAVKCGEIDLKHYIHLPSAPYSRERNVYGLKDTSRLQNAHIDKTDLDPSSTCLAQHPNDAACNLAKQTCENTEVNKTPQSQQPVKDLGHAEWRSSAEPQISGPLYSCFEMFDFKDGLAGSRSDTSSEVCKKHKMTDLFDEPGNKHTEKRGKEIILNELTEFMRTSNQLDACARKPGQSRSVSSKCLEECSAGHETQELPKPGAWRGTEGMCNEPSTGHSQLGGKDYFGDSHTTLPEDRNITKTNLMAKICPKCSEVNSKAANWCIECGSALVTVKPSFLTVKQEREYEKQCKKTKSLIWETMKSDKAASINGTLAKSRDTLKSVDDLSNHLDNSLAFAEGKFSHTSLDYKRRWLRSSIAWSSYDSSELSKPSSLPIKQTSDKEINTLVGIKQFLCDVSGKCQKEEDSCQSEDLERSTMHYMTYKQCSQPTGLSESTGCRPASVYSSQLENCGSCSAQVTHDYSVECRGSKKQNVEQRTSSEV